MIWIIVGDLVIELAIVIVLVLCNALIKSVLVIIGLIVVYTLRLSVLPLVYILRHTLARKILTICHVAKLFGRNIVDARLLRLKVV